jgi:hypothetical protein
MAVSGGGGGGIPFDPSNPLQAVIALVIIGLIAWGAFKLAG